MSQILTILVDEISLLSGVVWKAIELSISLNYKVMSMFVTLASRCIRLLFLFLAKASNLPSVLADDIILFLVDVGNVVLYIGNGCANFFYNLANFFRTFVTFIVNTSELTVSKIANLFTVITNTISYLLDRLFQVFVTFSDSIKLIGFTIVSVPYYIKESLLAVQMGLKEISLDNSIRALSSIASCISNSLKWVAQSFLTFLYDYTFITLTSTLLIFIMWQFQRYLRGSFRDHVALLFLYIYSFASNTKAYLSNLFFMRGSTSNNHQAFPPATVNEPATVSNAPNGAYITNSRNRFDHLAPAYQPPIPEFFVERRRSLTRSVNRSASHPTNSFVAPKGLPFKASSSKNNDSDSDSSCTHENLCIVCDDVHKNIVLLPCRHFCLCRVCYLKVRRKNNLCPLCRKGIQNTIEVYS